MSGSNCVSSGLKTSSGAVLAVPGELVSVVFNALAAGTPILIVYDNASAASGTVLFKAANPAAVKTEVFCPSKPIECKNGIYVSITNCEAVIHYA